MIYLLIGISILFIIIGFLVTERNAQYVLSGYNTMSEEKKKQFPIKSYLQFFRNFHIILGASYLVIGYLLFLLNENIFQVFLPLYPVLAYLYFNRKSGKFLKQQTP
ncbi:DUF3784 domain-containing protein [Maribacter confluentis]|uniref:DUF3784 domain-containing protein n=1 Tax=Maribacter confluentis TaxID=1656093 RepID=A0ABT8RMX1_9FLAO|nr:DUF3784 domain-containing protein [Maribacter confluentis]MDO1512272.1 DUF3784 domain-containing protein [Maribacter confluentis]